jgi:hypothetical protein
VLCVLRHNAPEPRAVVFRSDNLSAPYAMEDAYQRAGSGARLLAACEALLGRVKGFQLGITGWASLLVKNHSISGCISLCKCFLPNLGSYPRWCAEGFGDRRQENVPPVSKGRFIVLAKSDVLGASHRLI